MFALTYLLVYLMPLTRFSVNLLILHCDVELTVACMVGQVLNSAEEPYWAMMLMSRVSDLVAEADNATPTTHH